MFYDSKYMFMSTGYGQPQSYKQNISNFDTCTSSHDAFANIDQKDDPLTPLLEAVTVI